MVRDADHIIVLDEGKVIESGKPASLIASGGWFSDFSKTTKEEYNVAEESEEENGEEFSGEV